MARTRCTRRRPMLNSYAEQQRSVAQVAARVPPTLRQFQLAVNYSDSETILDFFTLDTSIQDDMNATNAYIVEHGDAPRESHDDHPNDPHAWFRPYQSSRRTSFSSVFAALAYRGLVDVMGYFLESLERLNQLEAVLTLVCPEMVIVAAIGGHVDLVEMVVASRIFASLAHETQQDALNCALEHTYDGRVAEILVSHGARIGMDCGVQNLYAWLRKNSTLVVGSGEDALLIKTMRSHHQDATELIQEIGVSSPMALICAVQDANPSSVEMLIVQGFVDVDARTPQGNTALMIAALIWNTYLGDSMKVRHEHIVRMLLEANADVTLCNSYGQTALHLAVAASNYACVDLLLDHIVLHRGMEAIHNDHTALNMAYEQRHAYGAASQRIVVSLLDHGACVTAYTTLLEHSDTEEVLEELMGRPCRVCVNSFVRNRRHDEIKVQ